jgi:hypothetical protein
MSNYTHCPKPLHNQNLKKAKDLSLNVPNFHCKFVHNTPTNVKMAIFLKDEK